MATADEYAKWIVDNKSKKGTPEFETVAAAYADARSRPVSQPQGISPSEMLSNAPASLWKNTVGGLGQAIMHPLDTAGTLLDAAAGGLQRALPESVVKFIDKADAGNPEAAAAKKRALETADAIGLDYKKTYGTKAGFTEAVNKDPFRILGDLSLIASGGATLAAKAPGVANALTKVAAITNPMNALIKPVQAIPAMVGGVGSGVVKPALGMTTGVGAENIAQAYKSGKAGNADFIANMRENVPKERVVEMARENLAAERRARSAEYVQNMESTAANTTALDFAPIDKALDSGLKSVKQNGHYKIGADEAAKLNEIDSVVAEWRGDPAAHTAIGLDALKQRLDAIYTGDPAMRNANRVKSDIRNTVKSAIVKQSPDYAKAMEAYEKSITLEDEITKALSLGDKASIDTTLRKLQSLGRNNVNANYGYRTDLANQLTEMGGIDFMPAIAGQAMSAKMPRGIMGQMAGAGGAYAGLAGLINPAMAPALLSASPRVVGEAGYALGRGVGAAQNALAPAQQAVNAMANRVPLTAQQAKIAALIAAQAANRGQTK